MPLIDWTNQMNVGVKLLNNDHRKLVILINNLHDGLVTGQAKPELESMFEMLVNATRAHHANEEQFLADEDHHSSLMHKQEHEQMLDKLLELQIRFINSAQLGVEMEIMHQLRSWLFQHVQGSDQQFAAHLKTVNVDAILGDWKSPAMIDRKIPSRETGIEQSVW